MNTALYLGHIRASNLKVYVTVGINLNGDANKNRYLTAINRTYQISKVKYQITTNDILSVMLKTHQKSDAK